jgi:hypothetical protein
VVAHGRAISAAGVAFDSCLHLAITNDLVSLTNYPIVIWACGNQSTADESYSSAEQAKVATFQAGGGNLFTSGAEIAWDLDRPSGPTTADRNFIHNQLHAAYVADSSGVWNFNAATNSIFLGTANGGFDDGSKGIYLVGFPDLLTPTNGGAVMGVTYSNLTTGAAGVIYTGAAGGGKVVYFGFPFETITSDSVRSGYMADVLNFFGVNPLRLDSVAAQAASQLRFVVDGPTGVYTLQTAAVLNAWGPLANFTNVTGTLTFINAISNAPVGFFRVKSFP